MIRFMLAAVLTLSLVGCAVDEKSAEESAKVAAVLSEGYVKNIDKTTAEQDKAHIKSMNAEFWAILTALVGGTEAARVKALVAPAPVAKGTQP